jgi:hypothetical protein
MDFIHTGIEEFTHHMSVSSEYYNSSLKTIWFLQMGPKTQNGGYLKNVSNNFH